MQDGPPSGAGALTRSEDLQDLRMRRTVAKAAGGVLELVMPMRVDGDGPTLFCAPPMVGLSWCYLALLPHLAPGFGFYGLQSRGLRRPEPLPTSMQEMARDFADRIRMIQPSGPYHLLGMSLGGNIALAIAEEMERRAERVGLLVILDAVLNDVEYIEVEPWAIYNLVLAQFGYVPALVPSDPDPESRMLELVRRRPGLGLDEWPDQRLRALQRVIRNNVAAGRAHRPGRVNAPVLFISAAQNPPSLAEKLDIWRSHTDGPIDSVELDCHHRQMLLPGPIERLGAAISQGMARVAAPSPLTG